MGTQIADLLIRTIFSLVISVFWLRFLLQLVKADFYNPICQWIVRATAPVLNPIQKIIPVYKGWHLGALAFIVLLQLVSMNLLALIGGMGTLPILSLVLGAFIQLLYLATEFYFWLLLISVVLSWVSPGYTPFGALIAQLAEPALAPFRRVLPPMGGLDLSPIIAFLTIQIIQIVLSHAINVLMGMGVL